MVCVKLFLKIKYTSNASKNRTFWIREQRNMETHDLGKVTKIWNYPSEKLCKQTTMKVKHRGTREKVQQAKCLQCGAEFRTHVESQAGCMYPQAQYSEEPWESETPWAPASLVYAMAMESHVKQADNEDRHQKLYLPHVHPIHTHEHTYIIHTHNRNKPVWLSCTVGGSYHS